MNAKSKIKITIGLTDEYRQAQLIETGKLPDYEQAVEYDLTLATPEQRAVIARATNGTLADLRLTNSHPEWTRYAGIPDIATLTQSLATDLDARDEVQREKLAQKIVEKTVAVLRAIAERKSALPLWCTLDEEKRNIQRLQMDMTGYDAALDQYKQNQPVFAAEEKAREAEHARYEAEKAARLEAEKAAREQEKMAWIAANGSDHLKRACIQHGHDCQRKYILERAAIEAPGYVVDFDDKAGWKARACPSLAALDELDAVIAKNIGKPEIVWLTDTGDKERDYDNQFDGCEAVVIRNYQGKYDLIKQI